MSKQALKLIVAAVALVLYAGAVRAQISDDDLCWEPDIEFPVPCEDDDD
jgi:hypothetical protein